MAFVSLIGAPVASPYRAHLVVTRSACAQSALRLRRVHGAGVRMQQQGSDADAGAESKLAAKATKPSVPEGFVVPEPKVFRVRPDQLLNIASGSIGSLFRAYSGALVKGYSLSIQNGTISEKSTSLPALRPQEPLVLFEYEACPHCRKVREALCILDLEAYIYPAPRGGKRFRPMLEKMAGKQQFPYLSDANTGFAGYESDDIVQYLFNTYGDGVVPLPLRLGAVTTASSGFASMARPGRGSRRPSRTVFPEHPLELWSYEPSPFCKIVREKLCDLELPYLLHNTARGSPKRAELKEKVGRFQVPYLEDANTGVKMFESADIVKYLDDVYGVNAVGAQEELPAEYADVMPKLSTEQQ